jgi:hypothetical protein
VAEQLILVCDVCGQSPAETVTIRAGNRTMLKDLCAKHLGELLTGTRAPKRGRPKSRAVASAKRSAVRSNRPGRKRAEQAATPRSGAKRGRNQRARRAASAE